MSLAKAYVQIIPSAEGIQGSLTDLMSGEASSAGASSGETLASSLFGKMKSALVGLGIGKAITDAISQTGEFETTMAKVSTLFTEDGAQFEALSQKILDVSSQTGMAATTLAEAAYSAESAGVPVGMLGQMIETSAQLAVAGFTDVDTALSATAKTMNSYGMEGEAAMNKVQGVLLQTQNLGITTVGELGASLANVTPTAAAMGVTFEQVGASLALMTAKGVPTAQATTQLRAAMTELGKAGTTADKSFRAAAEGSEYAGMSFQEAIASGANLGDVFSLMQSYANASGLSMVDLWGSVEAGNAAMMIAGDIETFNKDLESMSDTAGLLEDSYGKMSESFGQSMNSLKESAKNLVTALFTGADISESFDSLLESAGDIGEKVLTWITNGIGGIADSLPSMIGSLIDFGAGLLDSITKIDWLDLGTRIINGIISGVGTLGTKLIELVKNAVKGITGEEGGIDFASIGQKLWDGATSIFTTATTWLKTIFDDAVTLVTGTDFSGIGTKIKEGVTSAIDAAGTFLSTLFSAGETAAEGVSYSGIGTKILEGVKSAIDSAGTFLSTLFQGGLNASKDEVEWPTLGEAIKTGATLALNGGRFLSQVFIAGRKLIMAIDWTSVGGAVSSLVVAGLEGVKGLMESTFKAAKTMVDNINWGEIGSNISSLTVDALIGVKELMKSIFAGAKALVAGIDWTGLGGSISSLVISGLTGVQGLIEGLFSGAKDLITGMDWTGVGSGISNLVIDGLTGIKDLMKSVFAGAKALVVGIDWSGLGTGISDAMKGGLEGAGKLLKGAFSAAHSFITGIDWAGAGATIQAGLGKVWEGLTSLLGGTLTGLGNAAEGVGTAIGTGAEGLVNSLTGNTLTGRIEELKTAMTELESAVTSGKDAAVAAAKEVSQAVKDGLKEHLSRANIKQVGIDALEGLADGLKSNPQISSIKTNAKIVADKIKDTWENYDFKTVGSGAIGVIADAMLDTQEDVGSAAKDVAGVGADQFTGTDWKGIGEDISKGIGAGLGYEGDDSFGDKMTSLCDDGMNLMSSGWESVGSDIIAGIVTGISTSSGILYNKLKSVALAALASAKSALGIGSPSKVMRDEVGRWIPAGIAEGIEQSGSIVTRVMESLASDVSSVAFAAAVGSQNSILSSSVAHGVGSISTAGSTNMENSIVSAIREGMASAQVYAYMDGKNVTDMVSRQMGTDLSARRFITT